MENTCGPYHLTYILRALGYRQHRDIEISEEYLAKLARTRIAPEEYRSRISGLLEVMHGKASIEEASRKYGRILYRYDMLVSDKPEELGTSAEGVKYALETVTEGKLVGIPIPSRKGDRILFTEQAFKNLVNLLIDKVEEWKYQAILNLQTSLLVNQVAAHHDILVALLARDLEEALGKSPWRVGHFVSLAGFIRRKWSNGEDILLLIRDTYKGIGYHGYHIQPLENVRKALIRDDGREGGILLIVERDYAQQVEREIRNIGLEIALWDNGSPF